MLGHGYMLDFSDWSSVVYVLVSVYKACLKTCLKDDVNVNFSACNFMVVRPCFGMGLIRKASAFRPGFNDGISTGTRRTENFFLHVLVLMSSESALM